MLYVEDRCCIQRGGWGGMITFIALCHQNMLLRWRCCYVEDVVTLKMLLCWRCYYKCFQNGFVDVKRKNAHVHFAHGSLVDYDIFMSIKRNLKFPKTCNSNVKKQKWSKWMNLKKTKQHWNSGQDIPDMSECGTHSWYSHVIGRTQNTLKHSEQWHFSNWNTMNFNCLLGNLQPLPLVWICMNFALDFPWYSWISLRRSPCLQTLEEQQPRVAGPQSGRDHQRAQVGTLFLSFVGGPSTTFHRSMGVSYKIGDRSTFIIRRLWWGNNHCSAFFWVPGIRVPGYWALPLAVGCVISTSRFQKPLEMTHPTTFGVFFWTWIPSRHHGCQPILS